jgi:arylsulfatase A-like enzyme
MYECIHRIPFLMAGPGIEGGLVREQLVQQTDIFPTACDFAGLPVPGSVQGLSLLPLGKTGNPSWPRAAAFAEEEGRLCVRTARYRMIYDPIGEASELYDHENDPWEMKNLYHDTNYRQARLDLSEEFVRFYARTQKQTLATSMSKGGGGGYMPPGPTNDLWWKRMDWDTVKKKYKL